MSRSSLFGRRIHISGSVIDDEAIAPKAEVERARSLVAILVKELIGCGATFVIPVDAEKERGDGLPICFDWLVWESIRTNIVNRPADAPNPLIVAVKHHKNEEQIPEKFMGLWGSMRSFRSCTNRKCCALEHEQ